MSTTITNNDPVHLRNYPCMRPWVGSNYKNRKLLIVCESHFLPDGITKLHHKAETWYEARQDCVPNYVIHRDDNVKAHSYMDTIASIRHYKSKRRYSREQNETYKNIESVTDLSFDDFAFFNYIFRPVDESAGGYYHPDFDTMDKDKEISKMIMEWFIHEHDPSKIVIASTCVYRFGGVKEVLNPYCEKGIKLLYTTHPNPCAHTWRLPKFSCVVPGFIGCGAIDPRRRPPNPAARP